MPMRLLKIGIAGALALATLGSAAGTSGAADAPGLKISPAQPAAGATITITPTSPCPAAPAGEHLDDVMVGVTNLRKLDDERTVEVAPGPDGSWTAQLTLDAGWRNGGYPVWALCIADSADPDSADSYFEYDGSLLVSSPVGQNDPVVRLGGTDRIGTAIAMSQDAFLDQAFGAVLTRADSFADALAGSALAQYEDVPLLLTGKDSLDPRVEAELKRVAGDGGTISLLGGSAAVSPAVEKRLTDLGYDVARYAGVNRYDTAVKIAEEAIQSPSTVLLADGVGFRDGLIGGAAAEAASVDVESATNTDSFGGALLLTNGSTMPAETAGFLSRHADVTTFAIGGKAAAAAPKATAIAGVDAPETSVKVADRFFGDPWVVGLASATNFPDALAGGSHAPSLGGPLLLTDPTELSAPVRDYLARHKALPIGFVYGGTAAVSDEVLRSAVAAIS